MAVRCRGVCGRKVGVKCDGMQGCLVGGRPGDDFFINHAVVSEHGASSRGNIVWRPLRVVGQQYFTGLVSLGCRGTTFSDWGPNTKLMMWVTLLDFLFNLRWWMFSLWTFLSFFKGEACLRVLARHEVMEQGRLISMPNLSILSLFEVPHGSTHWPFFRATALAISPSCTEDN